MRRIALLLGIFAVALLAACNQAEEAPATQTQTSAAPATAAQTEGSQSPAAASPGPKNLTLASGEQLDVISVGFFDENLQSLDGLVAIEGRVKESYADRGALILVDCANMAGCNDGCCPQAEVPVRLDMSNYTGELPAADAEVVIVGDLTVQELGYELAVREIRQDDQPIVTAKT